MQVLKRGVKIKGNCVRSESSFRTSLAHWRVPYGCIINGSREVLVNRHHTPTHCWWTRQNCCTTSCTVQVERWNGSVLDIKSTVAELGYNGKGLLRMHALSGSDTVSYPNGRGKASPLRVLTQTDIDEFDSVLRRAVLLGETCSQQALPSFCPSTVRKNAPRWMLRCMKYTARGRTATEIGPQPMRTWHCTFREPICKIVLWNSECVGQIVASRRTTAWLITDGKWRNRSTWCPRFLGSQLNHRSSRTSPAAYANQTVKSGVEGVAIDPMECRVPATVSESELFYFVSIWHTVTIVMYKKWNN